MEAPKNRAKKTKITKKARDLYQELCEANNLVMELEAEIEEELWVDNVYEVKWL